MMFALGVILGIMIGVFGCVVVSGYWMDKNFRWH